MHRLAYISNDLGKITNIVILFEFHGTKKWSKYFVIQSYTI